MKPEKMEIYIYADSPEEVDACRKAIHAFIEENRQQGRAITARKLTEALSKWKSNAIVKAGIINFLNRN